MSLRNKIDSLQSDDLNTKSKSSVKDEEFLKLDTENIKLNSKVRRLEDDIAALNKRNQEADSKANELQSNSSQPKFTAEPVNEIAKPTIEYVNAFKNDGTIKRFDTRKVQDGTCIYELYYLTDTKIEIRLTQNLKIHDYVLKDPKKYFSESVCSIKGFAKLGKQIRVLNNGGANLNNQDIVVTPKNFLRVLLNFRSIQKY